MHSTLGLLPLVWLLQLLFTAGLGYLAAGFTVFLRDIPQTLGVILNLWFYLTPITYPASVIPQQLRGWVFWLNPLAAIEFGLSRLSVSRRSPALGRMGM